MKSTITAIATPMHQSAIGIIRISGPDAEKILKKIFLFKKKILKLENRKLYFGSIIDENKNHIDEALAFLMSSPNSYTGEDIVEIQTHGSVAVLKITLELIIKAGAVLAEPGEFTKRAFLNGKMDLTEAEAVADIISAKTKESLILSVKQKEGAYSNIIDPIREEILSYLALMEAHIDFCEEDIPEIDMKYFSERLNFWEKNIKNILKKIKEKNVYSEGITAVITGKTNVGKSSLLNTLLNEDRAIVTDIAGTTRDTLDAYINIKGIPLKIIDTAGIRSNPDSIEQIGISKTFKSIEKADIILFIADNSSNLTNEDIEILERLKNKKILILVNKSDIDRKLDIKFFSKYEHIKLLQISSKTRLGINNLINTIYDFIKRDMDVIAEKIYVNIRQKEALKNAVTHIENLKVSVLQERAFDFLTIDLNSTLNELGRLTGETVSADIINEIFGRFCIGK